MLCGVESFGTSGLLLLKYLSSCVDMQKIILRYQKKPGISDRNHWNNCLCLSVVSGPVKHGECNIYANAVHYNL